MLRFSPLEVGMARANRRPRVPLSVLPVSSFELSAEGRCVLIRCWNCGVWRRVKRSMIWPHRQQDEQSPWCRGSGQRLVVDISYAELAAERRLAAGLAAQRATKLQLPYTSRRTPAPPALRG
jgi:hypothetical protein